MKLSSDGRSLIQRLEGVLLKAYPDGKGQSGEQLYSIGYGHNGVAKGTVISQAEAERLFELDVQRFERCVAESTVEATQAQFDAMVSLCYNIGTSESKGFPSSTVARLHNVGDYDGAAEAFRLWKKSEGKTNPVLVARRETELAVYQRGSELRTAPTTPIPAPTTFAKPAAAVLVAGAGLVFFCRDCGAACDSVTVGYEPKA